MGKAIYFLIIITYYFTHRLRSPTNSENVACATLQIIFNDCNSYFRHLYDELYDNKCDRFFRSSNNSLTATEGQDKARRLAERQKDTNFELYHPKAHSEDKIYYILNKNYKMYIDEAWNENTNIAKTIKAVILHIHTRFDMCASCTNCLSWELKSGVAQFIIDYCHTKNSHKQATYFTALVSSRQPHIVWGHDRRTLPKSPPLHNVIGTQYLFDLYQRRLNLSQDLFNRGHEDFAQAAVSSFFPPSDSSSYLFARADSNTIKIWLSREGNILGICHINLSRSKVSVE